MTRARAAAKKEPVSIQDGAATTTAEVDADDAGLRRTAVRKRSGKRPGTSAMENKFVKPDSLCVTGCPAGAVCVGLYPMNKGLELVVIDPQPPNSWCQFLRETPSLPRFHFP